MSQDEDGVSTDCARCGIWFGKTHEGHRCPGAPQNQDGERRAARARRVRGLAADAERDERLREALGRALMRHSVTEEQAPWLTPDRLLDELVQAARAEIARLDAVVTAVRGLHKRNPLWDNEAEKTAGYYNTDDMCVECCDDWPCDTVQVLDKSV